MLPTETLKGQRIYFDSNVIIYQLIGYQALQAQLAAVFGMVDEGECQAVTSELTLAEVLVRPMRRKHCSPSSMPRYAGEQWTLSSGAGHARRTDRFSENPRDPRLQAARCYPRRLRLPCRLQRFSDQ